MDIDAFNAAAPDEARAVIAPCAAIPSWVDAVVEERPYPDTSALRDRAADLAAQWTPEEVDAALADHPRIGERHTAEGESARLSDDEQSSLDADRDREEALAAGNAAYERQFGRVFLIRAAGRSADDVLHELTRRLLNDSTTEDAETVEQLREIALLRLAGAVR